MKRYQSQKILAIISFIISSISLAIVSITLLSKVIYPLFINIKGLDVSSGLTVEQLMESYNAMIDYIILPNISKLDLIYFSSSEKGLQHFADVKILMLLTIVICIISIFISIYWISFIRNKRQTRKMDVHFNIAIILPLAFLFSLFLAFDRIFVMFHQLFFHNNYWLFDPLSDPIITVLPESFFMLLSILIIILYEIFIILFKLRLKRKK